MPHTVERVESKRDRKDEFRATLQPSRHRLDQLDQVCRVDGRESGVKEVQHGSAIEGDGEGRTGDSIGDGQQPCHLKSKSCSYVHPYPHSLVVDKL
jgi:hypothetical protein